MFLFIFLSLGEEIGKLSFLVKKSFISRCIWRSSRTISEKSSFSSHSKKNTKSTFPYMMYLLSPTSDGKLKHREIIFLA